MPEPDLVPADICSNNENSVLCALKNYITYLINATEEALKKCSIPFAAFGLRLLFEVITLGVYIDLHLIYKDRPLQEKLRLIQDMSLGMVIIRSTFFRRIIIRTFGPIEGRKFINDMKGIYVYLSKYLHVPTHSCLINFAEDLCVCSNEVHNLIALSNDVIQLAKKLINIWEKKLGKQ